MRLPGIGFTSASWIAYRTQNAVRPMNSPGSNQPGDKVTYSAQRISPSGRGCDAGLVCAATSSTGPTARDAYSAAATTTDRGIFRARLISVSPPSGRHGLPRTRTVLARSGDAAPVFGRRAGGRVEVVEARAVGPQERSAHVGAELEAEERVHCLGDSDGGVHGI